MQKIHKNGLCKDTAIHDRDVVVEDEVWSSRKGADDDILCQLTVSHRFNHSALRRCLIREPDKSSRLSQWRLDYAAK